MNLVEREGEKGLGHGEQSVSWRVPEPASTYFVPKIKFLSGPHSFVGRIYIFFPEPH